MAQIRETRCLTKSQITTILDNWCDILGVKSRKVLFDGKPVFSAENIKLYKIPHLTKFADNYTLYECTRDKQPNLYIITFETDKFDKVNLQACIWFWHYFDTKVYQTQNKYPEVFICPAYVITQAMQLHVPINLIPCMYRFVPLPEIYPLVGSKNQLYSMTYDYKIVPESEIPDNRQYSILFDNDPVIKVLNALPGDIIQYKRILCEGCPYAEYYRREVVSTVEDVNSIAKSGICYGKIVVE